MFFKVSPGFFAKAQQFRPRFKFSPLKFPKNFTAVRQQGRFLRRKKAGAA